jgi:hypothetical protein
MSFLVQPSRFLNIDLGGGIEFTSIESTEVTFVGTTYSMPISPTLLEGDLVIAFCVGYTASHPTGVTGYTEISYDATGNNEHAIAYKFMGATPDTTIPFVFSASQRYSMIALYLRGVSTISTIQATTAITESVVGSTFTIPSLTAASNGSAIVDFITVYKTMSPAQLTENTSIMDGMTVKAHTSGTSCANNGGLALAYKTGVSAGSVATRTYNYGCTDVFGTNRFGIVLNPL